MALSRHDLLRLLESLRSAAGLELVRGAAECLLQELIEAEATARIGAEWGEWTEARTAWRNGYREKITVARRLTAAVFPQVIRHKIIRHANTLPPPDPTANPCSEPF